MENDAENNNFIRKRRFLRDMRENLLKQAFTDLIQIVLEKIEILITSLLLHLKTFRSAKIRYFVL